MQRVICNIQKRTRAKRSQSHGCNEFSDLNPNSVSKRQIFKENVTTEMNIFNLWEDFNPFQLIVDTYMATSRKIRIILKKCMHFVK